VLVVRVLDEPGVLGDFALVIVKGGYQHRFGLRHNPRHIGLGVDDLAVMDVMTFE
jgi:hypothetical protein